MPVIDEINDNIPCPECGQDQCICEISEADYYDDDDSMFDFDDEESEDEIIP
jgi:hypothetical protein